MIVQEEEKGHVASSITVWKLEVRHSEKLSSPQ